MLDGYFAAVHVLLVCRTALRLHLDGQQLASQLLMSSAWSESSVNVIQQEWQLQQVNCMHPSAVALDGTFFMLL